MSERMAEGVSANARVTSALALCMTFRVIGVAAGCLLLLIAAASSLYSLPHDQWLAMREIATVAKVLILALLLVLPYRKLRGPLYVICLSGLSFYTLLTGSHLVAASYQRGGVDIVDFPTNLFVCLLVAGNTFSLWFVHRHGERGNA